MGLLSQSQWEALTRLYAAGKAGIPYEAGSYRAAGSWDTLLALRDHDPPLAREVTRPDPRHNTTHFLVVITEAGELFYERNRRLYNALYPP